MSNKWLISLRRHARKMFGRDKPSFTEAEELIKALREILDAEPSIDELKWHGIYKHAT